jgi:hypothetical protein
VVRFIHLVAVACGLVGFFGWRWGVPMRSCSMVFSPCSALIRRGDACLEVDAVDLCAAAAEGGRAESRELRTGFVGGSPSARCRGLRARPKIAARAPLLRESRVGSGFAGAPAKGVGGGCKGYRTVCRWKGEAVSCAPSFLS